MRIGINGSVVVTLHGTVEAVAQHAREAAADGFSSYWLQQSSGGGLDALTTIVAAARDAPGIEFGTAVIPTFPLHPAALAKQAATVQSIIGNRLALGIGLSHKESVEATLHVPYERPIRHMREYLDILTAMLRTGRVSYQGEIFSCDAELNIGIDGPPPIITAALGPQMLRLTGRHADGTILWLVGPKTIANHVAPEINRAAEQAGRPAPRIIASLPVCVTDDPATVCATISNLLQNYGDMPNYRAVLDREGVAAPGDVSVVGSEDIVRAKLQEIADAGATEFAAVEFPAGPEESARTRALLKELAAANN